jgi:thioredoxin 2
MIIGAEPDPDKIEAACASCGARNRFPRARLRDDPTCGRCKGKVFPRAPVHVTDDAYRAEVEECPLPVLIDFWAGWCAPCKQIAPALEQLAAERAGKLKVVKIDVDANPRAAARFGVRSIPTLQLLRGPIEVDKVAGALPKASLDAWLDRYL